MPRQRQRAVNKREIVLDLVQSEGTVSFRTLVGKLYGRESYESASKKTSAILAGVRKCGHSIYNVDGEVMDIAQSDIETVFLIADRTERRITSKIVELSYLIENSGPLLDTESAKKMLGDIKKVERKLITSQQGLRSKL